MFEKEIKFIGDFSLTKVNKLAPVVTFEKLANAGLHPAIITYISAELDYMIHRDRQKLLKESIFDYSGKEVDEHFKVISNEIKLSKKISFDDISKLILQAVSFNANYVVRPKWSLTKFIYNDQNFIAVEELELMLNYLYYYDYIKNVLTAYISKRKVVQLTLTEFDLILNKIDRELFKSNSEELINNAIHSIADFFNVGGLDKNRLALTSVEILLKEKNLMDYLLRLRRTIPGVSKKKYEISDIKKVLYSTKPLKPGSIPSYDPGKMEIIGEPRFEPAVEKTVEDTTIDDSEIVQEEEIVSASVDEENLVNNVEPEEEIITKPEAKIESEPEYQSDQEPEILPEPMNEFNTVFGEKEDSLPIEEEFLGGFKVHETSESGPMSQSEMLLDEEEDLLPIEEEFLNEFKVNETPEPEPEPELQIEEEQYESLQEEKPTDKGFTELEADLNELIERNSEKETLFEESAEIDFDKNESVFGKEFEPASKDEEDDELLVFYENELSLIDDDDSDLVIVTEEGINKSEEKEQPVVPDLTEQESKLEEEIERFQEEQGITEEDILSKDDFDLSIFDEETSYETEIEPVKDEIGSQPELLEISKPVESETDEKPVDLEEGLDDIEAGLEEIEEEPEQKMPVENEIINEMLEDYFGDEKKEEAPKSKTESFKLADDEFELEQDDDFEAEFNSILLDNLSIDKHISNVLEEIDDILKEDQPIEPKVKKPELPKEIPGQEEKIESKITSKPVSDQKDNVETNLFGDEIAKQKKSIDEKKQELGKNKKSPVPKSEAADKGKDFFSYLTKKEMKKIVSIVFGGDDGDFVTTIEKISECSSYKEATEILKGVFFSYRVSPYSKEAVLLTNAVSNFFRQT